MLGALFFVWLLLLCSHNESVAIIPNEQLLLLPYCNSFWIWIHLLLLLSYCNSFWIWIH